MPKIPPLAPATARQLFSKAALKKFPAEKHHCQLIFLCRLVAAKLNTHTCNSMNLQV